MSEAMEPKQSQEKKTEAGVTELVKGGETKNSMSSFDVGTMMKTDRITASKVKETFCIRNTLKPRPKPSPLRQVQLAGSHESHMSVH
jgi:hypothetical protein